MTAITISDGCVTAEGLRQLDIESGGAFDVDVVLRDDWPDLAQAFLADDPRAARLLAAIISVTERQEALPPGQSEPCRRCRKPLEPQPCAVGTISPANEAGTVQLVFALCSRCASDHTTGLAAAMEVAQRLRPDAKPFTITHPQGGRA